MYTLKSLLTITILLAFVSIGNSQITDKKRFKEIIDEWPVPKNPIEGEIWKQAGHYWFYINGKMMMLNDSVMGQDTLTAERFVSDSNGNPYMIEYKYTSNDSAFSTTLLSRKHLYDLPDSTKDELSHSHYIALVNIISFKGNHKKIIASNIKGIYSPTECSADNPDLWGKRLNEILKNKK